MLSLGSPEVRDKVREEIENMPECLRSLKPEMMAAILLIAGGHDYRYIADTLRIDKSTLYKWRGQEDFKLAHAWAIARMVDDKRSMVSSAHSKAMKRLLVLMDESKNEMVQLRAAQAIIKHWEVVFTQHIHAKPESDGREDKGRETAGELISLAKERRPETFVKAEQDLRKLEKAVSG